MRETKHSLDKHTSSIITNTESPQDFDPMKLYEFRDICIEALKRQTTIYFDSLKYFEEYKKVLEQSIKEKNKIQITKKISSDVLNSKYTVNQINFMIQTFSDAKKPEDLIKLELFNK